MREELDHDTPYCRGPRALDVVGVDDPGQRRRPRRGIADTISFGQGRGGPGPRQNRGIRGGPAAAHRPVTGPAGQHTQAAQRRCPVPTWRRALVAAVVVSVAAVATRVSAETPSAADFAACNAQARAAVAAGSATDRKSTRLNSSHGYISYAVFCLKKKKKKK